MVAKAITQYLQRHAETEVHLAAGASGSYRGLVVVPACNEHPGFLEGLRPAFSTRALLVIVVNGRDDQPADVHAANARLLRAMPATLGAADVLVIDRASVGRRLPAGEGVGLARKIGLDLGVAMFASGRLEVPWLHTTDADVVLPSDYFGRVCGGAAATHYAYWHVPGGRPLVDHATAHYEVWLRYWTAGLRWAGSPYAHPALGSCMAVDVMAYAAVRGVPRRRQAGEDFHLLDKLAKYAKYSGVALAPGAPVRIRSRESVRVPFGTGPGVRARMELLAAGRSPRLPDPRCFAVLRRLLAWVDATVAAGTVDLPMDLGPEIRRSVAERIVAKCNIRSRIERALPGGGGTVGSGRRVRETLDGLVTVRFLHAVRDAGVPDGPWSQMLQAAPFVEVSGQPRPLLHRIRRQLSLADGTQLA